MSTPREIFLETIRPDGRPERILDQYEALGMVLNDPINTYLRGNRRRGTTSLDRWGTTITWPEDAPGSMPLHGPELTVLQDVARWRETVHAPDLEANCAEGWEDALALAEKLRGEKFQAPEYDESGFKGMRTKLKLGITLDERIADGYYYSRAIRLAKHLMEHPELLERPASEPVEGF